MSTWGWFLRIYLQSGERRDAPQTRRGHHQSEMLTGGRLCDGHTKCGLGDVRPVLDVAGDVPRARHTIRRFQCITGTGTRHMARNHGRVASQSFGHCRMSVRCVWDMPKGTNMPNGMFNVSPGWGRVVWPLGQRPTCPGMQDTHWRFSQCAPVIGHVVAHAECMHGHRMCHRDASGCIGPCLDNVALVSDGLLGRHPMGQRMCLMCRHVIWHVGRPWGHLTGLGRAIIMSRRWLHGHGGRT